MPGQKLIPSLFERVPVRARAVLRFFGDRPAETAAAAVSLAFFLQLLRMINIDMGADEGAAFFQFVNEPVSSCFRMDFKTTNHVFFNILEALYLELFRIREISFLTDFMYLVRVLPAAFALGALCFTFRLGILLFDRTAAALSVAFLATCVPFYNYAALLRGYCLGALLIAMLIYYSRRLENEGGHGLRNGFFVFMSAFLAMLTTPVNIYAVFGVGAYYISAAAWIDLKRRLGKIPAGAGKKASRGRPGRRSSPAGRRYFLIAVLVAAGFVLSMIYYAPYIPYMLREKPEWHAGGRFNSGIVFRLIPAMFKYFLSEKWLVLPVSAFGIFAALVSGRLRDGLAKPLKGLFVLGIFFFLPFIPAYILGTETLTRIFVNLAPIFALFFGGAVSLALRAVRIPPRPTALIVLFFLVYSQLVFAACLADVEARTLEDIENSRWSQDSYYSYYFGHFRVNSLIEEFSVVRRKEIPVVILTRFLPFHTNDLRYYFGHWNIPTMESDDPGYLLSRNSSFYVITPFEKTFAGYMHSEYPYAWCKKMNRDTNFYSIFLVGIGAEPAPDSFGSNGDFEDD